MPDCLMCNGGQVDLHVSGVYVDTIDCPDCNGTGRVISEVHSEMQDSLDAFSVALADEQYKY